MDTLEGKDEAIDELKIFEDKDGAVPCLGDVEGDVDAEVICDML